jgi:hypothetical protein
MTAPVDIVNLAADQIGARASCQGINPPVPPDSLLAQVASRNYQIQVDATCRAAHWNCLRFQATLTLLKAALGTPENPSGSLPQPPYPWRYEYALPPDCLKARFVMPSPVAPQTMVPIMGGIASWPYLPGDPTMPFTPAIDTDQDGVQINVLLSNAPKALLVYTARINNPDLWDAGLRNSVIAVLAAWFVNPINNKQGMLQERVAIAQGMITNARVSDGNENILSVDHVPDFVEVRRFGGPTMWLYGATGPFIAAWDTMSLPGGVTF